MKKKNLVFTIIAIVSVLLMIVGAILSNKATLPISLIGATSLFVIGILTFVVKKDNKIIRIIALTFLYMCLLTYIIPGVVYYSDEISSIGINRMSLYDLFLYPYNTLFLSNSFQAFMLIIIVGGFYAILEKTGKYKSILEKIAKSLKGNELLFLGAIALLFAVLSSILGFNVLLFVFIPAIISIILLLGFDKLTAFMTAFISPIIGIIGSTYSSNIASIINAGTSTETGDALIAKIALLAVSYTIFMIFLTIHAKKSKHKFNEVKEQLELSIADEKKSTKKPTWPIIVIFSVLFVILFLGYTAWEEVFNVEIFTKMHEAITEFKIGNYTIFGYLIGNASPFGYWQHSNTLVFDYQNAMFLLVIASALLSLIYNISAEEAISAFAKGAKKLIKPAILVMVAYSLLFINGNYSLIPAIIDFVFNLFKNTTGFIKGLLFIVFSGIFTILSTFINVDTYYLAQLSTAQMASYFPSYNVVLSLVTSAFHGIAYLFVPTSTMMILGLSYLGISYKEWIKSSWKLLALITGGCLLVIAISTIIIL